MPILITGAGRSGTSLTASVLEVCGASLGQVNSLYEHQRVREQILKPMLEGLGADRLGQDPLPPVDAHPVPGNLRAKVEFQIDQPEPWAYKDAKLALVWRTWVEAFPDAKWVICRREPDAIAESCKRSIFMQSFTTVEEWREWAERYIWRLEDLAVAVDHVEVWPGRAVSGDLHEYRRMVEFCGLQWNETAVRQTVDPRQWHA